MRISDWSADVCSSDLAVPVHVLRFDAGGERQARVPRVTRVQDQQREHAEQQLAPQRDSRWQTQWLHVSRRAGSSRPAPTPCAARKSVGWGECVSVRVDLGGRHIIKKKKNN